MTSDSDAPDNNKNLKWAMGAVGAVAVLATVVVAKPVTQFDLLALMEAVPWSTPRSASTPSTGW